MPTDLAPAVDAVVDRCLAIRPEEDVLVVCDPTRTDIAQALHEGALARGADSVLMVMPPRPERGTEPPPAVAEKGAEVQAARERISSSLTAQERRDAAVLLRRLAAQMDDL